MYIYIYMYVYVCMYIYIYTYTYVQLTIHIITPHIHTGMCTRDIHKPTTQAQFHMYVHTCTYTSVQDICIFHKIYVYFVRYVYLICIYTHVHIHV